MEQKNSNWKDTTWIGFTGGGFSMSIVGGVSFFQFEIWNMGSNPLPARVIITGKRLGAMIEAGTGMAMLLITGCKNAQEMEGIESSGIDWELDVGINADAIFKGSKLFKETASLATKNVIDWAGHEQAKRLAQFFMGELGIVQPGKQFNLLPSPASIGAGAGLFYEWQKLHVLRANVGWQHIAPTWSVTNVGSSVRLEMSNIPEQDGTPVKIGIYIDEWGYDPLVRWQKKGKRSGIKDYHITGYAYGGKLYAMRSKSGQPGINLSALQPIGQLDTSFMSNRLTNEVQKRGTYSIRPAVFNYTNLPYWKASNTVKITLGPDGCFLKKI